MEESTQETLNPAAGEATSVTTPSVEEPTTSVDETAPQETESQPAETPVEQPQETERQPERPAQRRIRELVNENKRLVEENSRFYQQPTQPQQAPKLSEMLNGRDQIDPSELDQIGQQYAAQAGQAAASLEVAKLRTEMQQKEAVSQYENDQRALEREYPELNPDSDLYNPVLEKAIAENWRKQAIQTNPYNAQVKQINPAVRLSDVAKDFMEVAQAAAIRGQAQANESVARTVDTSAITPNAQSARDDTPFENKSLAEMERDLRSRGYKI